MRLLTFLICVIAGVLSCFAFGDWVQAQNPFPSDFRVQAYAIPFVVGFLICRLTVPAIGALASRRSALNTNR